MTGKLTPDTWVPLGRAAMIAAGLFSGAWMVARQLSALEHRLDVIEDKIEHTWSLQNMSDYSNEMRWGNRALDNSTGLYVPDPKTLK